MHDFYDASLIYVAAVGLYAAIYTACSVRRAFEVRESGWNWEIKLALTALACGVFTLIVAGHAMGTLFAASLATAFTLVLRLRYPQLTFAGALEMAMSPLAWLVGSLWSYNLVVEGGAPEWSQLVVLGASALAGITVFLGFLEKLARHSILTHRHWRRPTQPMPRHDHGHDRTKAPRVSIHVPAYAEPPAMLNEVLDRLARLDYPDYEVLVCDNNTADEGLWRPVEAHCARLNAKAGEERFRFFHVAPLDGAKAGALNWLLDRMDKTAELIAVIDADYLAEPDFLSRLVGFFDDEGIGYVQTPHDYREHADPYLTACYWEYMPCNKVEMPGINEYGAAFTIGTMCLIRTRALREAGDWAEWCLTEDSEVSVRLREAGYGGVFLRDTFGRGLIPETFDDYKKQRFRWTAGPVQQLRRHWRLYLPRRLGGSEVMDGWNKMLEVLRGIAPLSLVGAFLLGLGSALGVLLSGAWGAIPPIDLSATAWAALAIGSVAALVRRWLRYRLSGCPSLMAMAQGELARLSLTYVQMVAGLAGLSRKPLAWRRTPKFAAEPSGWNALRSTLPEAGIAAALLLFALVPLALHDRVGGDMALLLAAALASLSGKFLAAPAMALLSERRLAKLNARDAAPRADLPFSATPLEA